MFATNGRLGELGNWGIGELGNWGIGELGNWGIGELGTIYLYHFYWYFILD
jgi:hypothetical protein